MKKISTNTAAVLSLIRPELLERSPYVAGVPDRKAIRLHANENPWSIQEASASEGPEIRKIASIVNSRGVGTRAVDSNAEAFRNTAELRQELNRYPEQRPALLVDKMAGYYGVAPQYVLPVRGGDDGIDLLIRAFCTAGKDSIQISSPTFGMYSSYAQIQNAAVVDVPLLECSDGFSLDANSVIEQGRSSKLVFLCSPNNPTGHSLSLEQISRICTALCGLSIVVLDEAYIEFSQHPSAAVLVSEYPNLVILRTLSKAHGAAGLRCGALLAHPDLVRVIQSICTPYALPTPIIELAISGLEPQQLLLAQDRCELLKEHCVMLTEALVDHPLVKKVYASDANFLLVRFYDAKTVSAELNEQGVLVRDFSDKIGCEGCLRISIGKMQENREVLRVLDSIAQKAELKGVISYE